MIGVVPTSGLLADRLAGQGIRTHEVGTIQMSPLGVSGRVISTRRAELVEADRRARYDKRTRTPCLYGLPASRKADLHEPGVRDSPADLCRGPARGSTFSSDCADLLPADPICGRRTKPRSAQSRGRHNRRYTGDLATRVLVLVVTPRQSGPHFSSSRRVSTPVRRSRGDLLRRSACSRSRCPARPRCVGPLRCRPAPASLRRVCGPGDSRFR